MDRYERIRELGRGSFGRALLVSDRRSRQLLVAKEMKVDNRQDLEDALVEARLMSKVDHLNIVRFHEVIRESPKLIAIIMEYCDDGDLADKIARRKLSHAYFHEEQFAQALQHLHSRGAIHRDVKSANVFFLSCGVLKLGDFGIARILDKNAPRMSARTARTPVGTPMYMAPELCNGQPYTQKADMWAMGCVLFEVLALRPAFVAQSMEMLLAKIKAGQHDRNMPRHYSPHLIGLVQSLLTVDEAKRPSASDVLRMAFLAPFVEQSPATLFSKGLFKVPVLLDTSFNFEPTQPPEILVIGDTHNRSGSGTSTVVESPGNDGPLLDATLPPISPVFAPRDNVTSRRVNVKGAVTPDSGEQRQHSPKSLPPCSPPTSKPTSRGSSNSIATPMTPSSDGSSTARRVRRISLSPSEPGPEQPSKPPLERNPSDDVLVRKPKLETRQRRPSLQPEMLQGHDLRRRAQRSPKASPTPDVHFPKIH